MQFVHASRQSTVALSLVIFEGFMGSHSSTSFALVSAIVCVLGATAGIRLLARENRSTQARAAIEQLHQQIVEATLSGKPDDLANLWDNDGVRLTEGHPRKLAKP